MKFDPGHLNLIRANSADITGLDCLDFLTRMHSSRMRTARSSSRPRESPPGPPWEEVPPKEEAPPRGSTPPRGGTPLEEAPPC